MSALPRLLFCSPHCYLDTSSGAALATRSLFESLITRHWPCAVYCGDRLDYERPPPLEQLFQQQGLTVSAQRAFANRSPFRLFDLITAGVPVTVFSTSETSWRQPIPNAAGIAFLLLLEGILDRFRPDVLLLYGGDELAQQIVARVRQRRIPVVFALHNFAYPERRFFDSFDAVVVPSRFAREYYRDRLGLDCHVLPYLWDWQRVRCERVEGRFVTFVNPQPHKGVFWFVRLAVELGRRRPDIPLLVVEGRAGVEWLTRTGVDLSGLTNLHRMANTPEPRDFYRVSRAILMPSLWQESLGRVAAESLINGIPVPASRRGALPEVLGDSGFLFDIPGPYTAESQIVPSAEDVTPWLATLERLWDDESWHVEQRLRCLATAERFRPELLLPEYESFFCAIRAQGIVS